MCLALLIPGHSYPRLPCPKDTNQSLRANKGTSSYPDTKKILKNFPLRLRNPNCLLFVFGQSVTPTAHFITPFSIVANLSIRLWPQAVFIKTQAVKEEKVASRKPEQNNYPGPYFTYPPHYPPYYPPFYNFNNQSHHVGNQNGQSYIVGNNRELFEDPEYECVGQAVFGRDNEESGYENCGQEVFETHFCEMVPDFRED